MAPNPVKGYDVVEDKRYKRDCKLYNSLQKRRINTEIKIVNHPESHTDLHGGFVVKRCENFLHARVNQKMRILYQPDKKHKIIFLKRFLTHTEMDQMC